jgi:hypothetical protein
MYNQQDYPQYPKTSPNSSTHNPYDHKHPQDKSCSYDYKPDNLRIGRLRCVEDGETAVEIVTTETVDDSFDRFERSFVHG